MVSGAIWPCPFNHLAAILNHARSCELTYLSVSGSDLLLVFVDMLYSVCIMRACSKCLYL